MNKYRVTIKEIEVYEIELDAEDEDHAIDQAWEKLLNSDDKADYHVDSDGESDVEDL